MVINISENFIGKRIDTAIAEVIESISRSQIQKYIKSNKVLCNGIIVNDISKKITSSCIVEILTETYEQDNLYEITPENIPLDIIFEDENILIINKPAGIVCHPAPGNKSGTIVNALMFRFQQLSDIGGQLRPGIVHRLDKDTSGLMLIAKTNRAHMAFSKLFSEHKGKLIKRKYSCFVFGVPKEKNGKIETFISRHPKLRQQYTASETSGKKAITLYSTQKSIYFSSTKAISKISCELLTGRTHQIRVHMKYLGNHIIGDKIYGKQKIEKTFPEIVQQFPRQALHSEEISFVHPITNQHLKFNKDIPEDMQELEKLFI